MATPLSVYVLTRDSEEHLDAVLGAVRGLADEIVVVDSGSSDGTRAIAERHGARWLERPFDHFGAQRNFAQDACAHDWVLALDSDEIMDAEMAAHLAGLKAAGFRPGGPDGRDVEAFKLRRRWYLFGREIRCLLPVESPDYPIRLFDRTRVRYSEVGNLVHESPEGVTSDERIHAGALHHYSGDTVERLYAKLNLYSGLAAREMVRKGQATSWFGVFSHATSAWFKWYVAKGGWRDGEVGFLTGLYASQYTFLKHLKRLFLDRGGR
ncbi:glycosyltransferase family 2 protein [bacterium]|nr:glycosyltransferase family 2 protein [bacterium]